MPKQKRVTKKEISSALKTIYSDESGNPVNMRVTRAVRPGKRKILVGLIVFFGMVSLVSWLGILVFSKFGGNAADNLKLNITGDASPSSGKEVEYTVAYKNNDNFPLASAELALFLPKSFILSYSNPELGDKNVLKIGTLDIGAGGSLKFKGKFFSTDGTNEIVQAVLTYKPANFNSNFQKVSNLNVTISGSSFDGSIEGPDKVSAGDVVSYKLIYQNKASEAFDKVAIDVILPADFMISTSTPAIGKDNRWTIGKLDVGAHGEINIMGSFASTAKGEEDIVFRLGIIDEAGGFLPLIEKAMPAEVVASDLVTSLEINDTDNFTAVKWGETLNYSITYKNAGKQTLYNVKFIVDLLGIPNEQGKSILDWSSLKDSSRGKVSGGEITWSQNEVPGLAQLKPGQEGIIYFSINLIPKPANPMYKDYKIESILESDIERVGNLAVKRQLQTNKITIFLLSDTEFTSQARYYDANNNMVGSGPLPPKVGQRTTYRIYWKVTNSMHELDNLSVSANLPDGVVWDKASADAGSIVLDSSLKKIVWSLNMLPNSANTITAQFDVSITPQDSDVGNILDLLTGIEFIAKDKSTGGAIDIKSANETTAMADDPYVTTGGKVTP